MMESYRVTPEWGIQLAFFAYGPDLDYENMKVHAIEDNYPAYVVARLDESFNIFHDRIEIGRYFDPYNKEVTRIGYAENINTLLLGGTYAVSDL